MCKCRQFVVLSVIVGFSVTHGVLATGVTRDDAEREGKNILVSLTTSIVRPGPRQRGHVKVNIGVANNSSKDLKITKWSMYLDCVIRDNVLKMRDEKNVSLVRRGRRVGSGEQEEREVLSPGESLLIKNLNITDFFDFHESYGRLWIKLDSVGWVYFSESDYWGIGLKTDWLQIEVPKFPKHKFDIPMEGRVVSREKKGKELVITCGS